MYYATNTPGLMRRQRFGENGVGFTQPRPKICGFSRIFVVAPKGRGEKPRYVGKT